MPAYPDIGKPPELAWLPADKLDVDPSYQRSLDMPASKRLIARIAENFSWMRFQAILATPGKPGRWLIIDGQHRAAAAKVREIAHLPAVVIAEASQAEQAAAFVGANKDRVPVSAPALFHARLAAGDVDAGAVKRACNAAGITLLKYAIGMDRAPMGTTPAVSALLYALRHHGEANMAAAVAAVAETCALAPGGLRGEYFLGASRWLYQGGAASDLGGRILHIGGEAGLRGVISGESGGLQTKSSMVTRALDLAGVDQPRNGGVAQQDRAPASEAGRPRFEFARPRQHASPFATSNEGAKRDMGAAPKVTSPKPVRPRIAADPVKPKPAKADDQAAIERFLAERGATKLPGFGDPALREVSELVWDRKLGKWVRPAAKGVA